MVLAIVVVYIGLIFLSSRFSRKKKGHNPWYVVAISMISTSISGVSFVSVPGMVEASSFSYLQMVLGFIAGYVVIAFVLLPIYYKLKLNNLYTYLKERFGEYSYKTGAAFFLLSKLLGTGVKMYLSSIVLQLIVFEALGVPFWINVTLCVLITFIYALRGLKSLVWTDMVQTLSILLVVGACIFVISKDIGDVSINSRVFFFDNLSDTKFFFKQFFAGIFTTIAMTGLDQDMMQKNLSCRSIKDSQKNVLSYGVAFLPVNLLLLILGVLLYQYAGNNGISVAKPDDLFPTIACNISLIVKALFVLGLVSSTLSSSGSALNALTTVLFEQLPFDLRLPRPKGLAMTKSTPLNDINPSLRGAVATKQSQTKFSSSVTRCNGVWQSQDFLTRIICTMALWIVIICFKMIGNESVINAVYTIASYTYGPLLALFGLGMFTKIRLKDKFVPIICVLSPIICLGFSVSCRLVLNYTIGFELLLLNAFITIIGLLLIKRD